MAEHWHRVGSCVNWWI